MPLFAAIAIIAIAAFIIRLRFLSILIISMLMPLDTPLILPFRHYYFHYIRCCIFAAFALFAADAYAFAGLFAEDTLHFLSPVTLAAIDISLLITPHFSFHFH
jgi:hypothetical protein